MKYLIVLLSGFEISDGVITHFLVRNGLAREGNPLMAPIVAEGNFLLLKIIGAILSALILWGIYKRFPRVALTAASSIVVFYGLVIAWNSSIFFNSIFSF